MVRSQARAVLGYTVARPYKTSSSDCARAFAAAQHSTSPGRLVAQNRSLATVQFTTAFPVKETRKPTGPALLAAYTFSKRQFPWNQQNLSSLLMALLFTPATHCALRLSAFLLICINDQLNSSAFWIRINAEKGQELIHGDSPRRAFRQQRGLKQSWSGLTGTEMNFPRYARGQLEASHRKNHTKIIHHGISSTFNLTTKLLQVIWKQWI